MAIIRSASKNPCDVTRPEIRPIDRYRAPVTSVAQLDDFELTVADRPSSFNKRIAMPADAWNIMASKFIEVAIGWEESPLDFNDCGYLYPRLDTDLGVELVGEPKKDRSI